jgi:hypothetical protein
VQHLVIDTFLDEIDEESDEILFGEIKHEVVEDMEEGVDGLDTQLEVLKEEERVLRHHLSLSTEFQYFLENDMFLLDEISGDIHMHISHKYPEVVQIFLGTFCLW